MKQGKKTEEEEEEEEEGEEGGRGGGTKYPPYSHLKPLTTISSVHFHANLGPGGRTGCKLCVTDDRLAVRAIFFPTVQTHHTVAHS